MPCGYCHGPNHNRRTCQYFNAEMYARMIAEGAGKNVIYRCIDAGLPGAGLALQVIEMAYNAVALAARHKRMSYNERYRKAIGLLMDVGGEGGGN